MTISKKTSAAPYLITSADNYIHVGFRDISTVSKNVLMAVAQMEGDTPADIGNALAANLAELNIPANAVAGMVFSIVCPENLTMGDCSSIVESIRRGIGDEAAIIWGIRFTDIGTVRITALLAVSQER